MNFLTNREGRLKRITTFAVVLVLAAVGTAASAQDASEDRMITRPDWERQPTREQMSALFPAAAMRAGKEGRAWIECSVATTGRMRDCVIIREEPEGYGFGAAALATASFFRMKPAEAEGMAIDGARVQIPVGFRCSSCNPQPIGRTERVYSNILWPEAPSFEQWIEAYPERARANPVDGVATLECEFIEGGRLDRCRVRDETPRGRGFGQAARAMAEHFRGPAMDQDGNETAGGTALINIAFPADLADGGRPDLPATRLMSGPTSAALDAFFPDEARDAGIREGRVMIRCRRQSDGSVSDCEIVEESHPDLNFGDAALALSNYLTFSSWSEDGRMTTSTVRVPFVFQLSPESESSPEG
jgi:TonB family protein